MDSPACAKSRREATSIPPIACENCRRLIIATAYHGKVSHGKASRGKAIAGKVGHVGSWRFHRIMAEQKALPTAVLIHIAKLLNVPLKSMDAVIELLDGGATVPFIARYRKEVTGNLDEVQIRDIQE